MGGCVGSEKPKPTGSEIPKKQDDPAQMLVNNNPSNSKLKASPDKLNPKDADPLDGSPQREQILRSWKKHPQRFVVPGENNANNNKQPVDAIKEEGDKSLKQSPIKQIDPAYVVQRVIENNDEQPQNIYPTIKSTYQEGQLLIPSDPTKNQKESQIKIITGSDPKESRESAQKNPTEVFIGSTGRRQDLTNLKAITEVDPFLENQASTIKKNQDNIDEIFNYQEEKKKTKKQIADTFINNVQPIDPNHIKPEIMGEKGPTSEIIKVEVLDIGKTYEVQSQRMFGEEVFLEDYQVDFQLPIFQVVIS